MPDSLKLGLCSAQVLGSAVRCARSESVIEVEQAALTAASPGPTTEPAQAHPTPATTSQTLEEDHDKLHA